MSWLRPFRKEGSPSAIDVRDDGIACITEKPFDQLNVSTPGPAELDINSPTWIYIKQQIEEKIAALRKRNDSLKLDPRKTDEIRGRIAALKELAAMPEKSWKTTSK